MIYAGVGKVLFLVLDQVPSTFHLVKYKYKYSKVLDPIKYFKYFSIKYKYKYFYIVTNQVHQVLLITYIQEVLNTITVLLLIRHSL